MKRVRLYVLSFAFLCRPNRNPICYSNRIDFISSNRSNEFHETSELHVRQQRSTISASMAKQLAISLQNNGKFDYDWCVCVCIFTVAANRSLGEGFSFHFHLILFRSRLNFILRAFTYTHVCNIECLGRRQR